MIEVTQTSHYPRGNCYAACIASIFHLDLSLLPALPESDEEVLAKFPIVNPEYYGVDDSRNSFWHDMWATWKRDNNLMSISIRASLLGEYDRRNFYVFHICNGPSPRDPEQEKGRDGMKHSVVGFKGLVRFDPHPSRQGLLAIDSYELIVPAEPARPILEGYRNKK